MNLKFLKKNYGSLDFYKEVPWHFCYTVCYIGRSCIYNSMLTSSCHMHYSLSWLIIVHTMHLLLAQRGAICKHCMKVLQMVNSNLVEGGWLTPAPNSPSLEEVGKKMLHENVISMSILYYGHCKSANVILKVINRKGMSHPLSGLELWTHIQRRRGWWTTNVYEPSILVPFNDPQKRAAMLLNLNQSLKLWMLVLGTTWRVTRISWSKVSTWVPFDKESLHITCVFNLWNCELLLLSCWHVCQVLQRATYHSLCLE